MNCKPGYYIKTSNASGSLRQQKLRVLSERTFPDPRYVPPEPHVFPWICENEAPGDTTGIELIKMLPTTAVPCHSKQPWTTEKEKKSIQRATAMHHQLPADWIVLDQKYPAHHAVRTATLKQYRPLCFVIERDPAEEAAKLEAVKLILPNFCELFMTKTLGVLCLTWLFFFCACAARRVWHSKHH